MQMTEDFGDIYIFGSGNTAHRLIHSFRISDIDIQAVIARGEKGKMIASRFGLPLIGSAEVPPHSTVILCVSDDALTKELFAGFHPQVLLCHTAGSVSINVFGKRKRAGVFYPLQTLSADREVDFRNVPVCIEANNESDEKYLFNLAGNISTDVRKMNSQQRLTTHLAAVFVSNFVNHLYKIAADILKSDNIDFDILKPLIAEVAAKVMEMSPTEAQTGPALRNDVKVLQKHIELLERFPGYQNIYKILSESIKENNK